MRSFCGGRRGKVFLFGYDIHLPVLAKSVLFAILCIFDPIPAQMWEKESWRRGFLILEGGRRDGGCGVAGERGGGREVFMMRDYLIYVLIYSGRTRGGLVAEKKRGESLTTRRRKSLGIEEGILSMQS